MEREVGGGIGMGKTCKLKKKNNKKKRKKSGKKKELVISFSVTSQYFSKKNNIRHTYSEHTHVNYSDT